MYLIVFSQHFALANETVRAAKMTDCIDNYKKPFSKESINDLPIAVYDGPIYLVEREEQLLPAMEHLRYDTLLGFDTEMRPCFERGKPPYPTALMQLAGREAVVLIRVQRVPVAGILKQLLEDPGVLKVGVAIADDFRLLLRQTLFHARGVVDLAVTARRAGLSTLGLRTLAANLLHVRISKTAQCSNWEKSELSESQVLYAATDAWVGREIYLKMASVEGFEFEATSVSEPMSFLPRQRRPLSTRQVLRRVYQRTGTVTEGEHAEN